VTVEATKMVAKKGRQRGRRCSEPPKNLRTVREEKLCPRCSEIVSGHCRGCHDPGDIEALREPRQPRRVELVALWCLKARRPIAGCEVLRQEEPWVATTGVAVGPVFSSCKKTVRPDLKEKKTRAVVSTVDSDTDDDLYD